MPHTSASTAAVQTRALRAPGPDVLAAFRRLDPAGQLAQLRGLRVERVFQIDRANGINQEARTAWLSIASETPYERWWGVEVLAITRNAIRDARLLSGAPLLVGHDTADQVGVIESYEITSGRRLRVLARFGRSARAEEIWADVLDGIRRNTSVGYIIHDLVLESSEEGINTYRVTDWEPLEGSLVSVPADHTVGVGRSLAAASNSKGRAMPNSNAGNPACDDQEHTSRSQRRRIAAEDRTESERIHQLLAAGDVFADLGGREIARELIDDPAGTPETFNLRMREMLRGKSKPTHTAAPPDTPYGAGAREELQHRTLTCFRGPDGVRQAYAFGQWLRAQVPGQDGAVRWCRENGMTHNRFLTGMSGPEGGYLVPEQLAAEVIKNMDTYGTFRQEARVWPMSSDSLSVPKRTGGVTAAFHTEDTEATASDPAFGSVNLLAKEVIAKTHITRSVLEDSVVDLGDYVGMEMAEAFALLEDQCGFVGTGTSAYGGMQGLNVKLKAATASQHTAAANHDTAPEIDATDLANLMAKLPQYAHRGAKWYMSMAFYGAIVLRLMMAGGGNTIRTLEEGSSANPVFAGYPVVLSPTLPSDVTADLTGEVMLAFGNLRRAAAFGDRRQISLLVDPYTLAGKSQIRVIGTERFHIVNHDVGDTSTTGPIVALMGA